MSGVEVLDRFFDRLMELRPIDATYYGLHQHDHRLPDGSLAGAHEHQKLLQWLQAELTFAEGGFDLDLARYYTSVTRFHLEELRLWARMPEAPDQIGTGVFLLLARDSTPLEPRLEAIASRLEAVPGYLAASRERLLEPVRLWCELGAVTARQLPSLFATAVESAPEGLLRRRLATAAGPASEAALDFARWLDEAVVPEASGDFALGAEGFARLLHLRELPDGPDALLALGRRSLEEFKAERAELIANSWPGLSVKEATDLLRLQQPESFEAALADYRQVIASARDFVVSRGLATLPPDEELRIEATPSFLRPVLPFAAYEPPACFDSHQLGIYMVTPQDGDLGEHSRASVLNTSVHEGYPGHHLQFVSAHQNPSIARLLSAECAHEYIEGWAHYCEQLMYECGFTSGPEVRLVQLNDLVWRACRVIIDVELSSGRMSVGQATRMLVEEASMMPSAAESEVQRYTFTPGYQLSYLYGKHLLLELRERRRQAEGAAFDLRAFHDRLLGSGAVPAATWDALF